jgi:hypothetical protein
MGKRDFGHRETKKPKKGVKKLHIETEFEQTPVVEVVKKNKNKEEI